jgi:hypothetical protein
MILVLFFFSYSKGNGNNPRHGKMREWLLLLVIKAERFSKGKETKFDEWLSCLETGKNGKVANSTEQKKV